jgi:hypothetical protein
MFIKGTTKVPSLFGFAPRELSQDAFLCWLLSWAHRDLRQMDEPLHKTGAALLNKLLETCKIDPPAVYKGLEFKRQYKGLDILVLVNEDIALLIEDKKDTCEHSGQLARYLHTVRVHFPGRKPAPVYLKTGNLSRYEMRAALGAGFAIFRRGHLLTVLEEGEKLGINNAIFSDYLLWLSRFPRVATRKALRVRRPPRRRRQPAGHGVSEPEQRAIW